MCARQRVVEAAATVALTVLLFAGGVRCSYCYNRQNETYEEHFKPETCDDECTVTPFFSPDTSLYTYVQLIKNARDTIDIYTPSMESWNSNCTHDTDCPPRGSCTGCPLEQQKNERFPVFPALLNAVHERDVRIRIITNNFTFFACEGSVVPMDWLVMNKIQVRFYTGTTFQHAKFITTDGGTKTAVSSVNWSPTSLLENREAGVILDDCSCSSFYQSVFEHDWENGIDYVLTRSYSKSEVDFITDTAHMPYTIPNSSITGTFVTKLIPHNGVKIKRTYASPDYARDTIMAYLSSVKKSLHLAIYQVTDDELCDGLLQLFKKGVNVTVLVSCDVIPYYNYMKAMECYKNLTEGGMQGRIQCACSKFRFSHEKYWIVDDTTVHLSTGNWSPSDYPPGSYWPPYSQLRRSINRDLQIVLEDVEVTAYFARVYGADWAMGKEWRPKTQVN